MHPFILALLGGILIGLAATLLLYLKGRVMGISGIVSGVLPPYDVGRRGDLVWRLAFIAGTVLAPALLLFVFGRNTEHVFAGGTLDIVLAGFFVGVGTMMGNGCTSGHGVCGLSRLSPRSLVATLVFMAVAMLTVFALRTVRGA